MLCPPHNLCMDLLYSLDGIEESRSRVLQLLVLHGRHLYGVLQEECVVDQYHS